MVTRVVWADAEPLTSPRTTQTASGTKEKVESEYIGCPRAGTRFVPVLH
jgi:hypothetical protein